jgi:hypothetical protein
MSTILGDKLTLVHVFGSVAFNDGIMSDWPGAMKCHVDNLDGWQETVDKNVVRSQRGVGDGDYIGNRWAAKSRMLMMEGYIHAPSRLIVDQTFDSIVANAFPDDTDITLTRFEPIPKYVVCRLAGKVELVQYISEGLRWRTTLLCADPFKYDALNTLSGTAGVAGVSSGGVTFPVTFPVVFSTAAQGEGNQIVIFNTGTARAEPIVTVHGPLTTGWRVESATTGEFSAFDISLGAADVLVMDHRMKTAELNGQLVSGLLTGKWWTLRPKSNTIRLYGDYNSAASFSIGATKSTWR